jgi:hypothetical protein
MQRAAARGTKNEFVNWDYHVFVIREAVVEAVTAKDEAYEEETTTTKRGNKTRKSQVEVLDVDTLLLPYPCPIHVYLDGSFPQYSEQYHHHTTTTNRTMDLYRPIFRVVPAQQYLRYFYSNRMHMYNEDNGQWSAPPPNYLPIMNGLLELGVDSKTGLVLDSNNNKVTSGGGGSNLETYINMTSNDDDDGRWGKVYTLDQFRSKYC